MIFFINNPNLTKKILAGGKGGGVGMARVSDFFYSKISKYENKKKIFEGVKVREDDRVGGGLQ